MKTAIHRHSITLPASLGVAKERVREEKGKGNRSYPRERCRSEEGCELAMVQLKISPLVDAVGQ